MTAISCVRRHENATVTAYCFGLLDAELRPLKRQEAEGALLPQVCCVPWASLFHHMEWRMPRSILGLPLLA